jgi:hypothetical protein
MSINSRMSVRQAQGGGEASRSRLPSDAVVVEWKVLASHSLQPTGFGQRAPGRRQGVDPEWLERPSNQALIERYSDDFPGEQWTKKHQQAAANEKTKMRRKTGLVRRRRTRGAAPTGAGPLGITRARTLMNALEHLELLVDDCLSLAIRQSNSNLDGVIKHLRVARRGIAWAMGERRL